MDLEPMIGHYKVDLGWRLRWLLWKGRQRTRLSFAWAARGRPSVYRELRAAEIEHRRAIERAFLGV